MSQQNQIHHLPEVIRFEGGMKDIFEGAIIVVTHPLNKSSQSIVVSKTMPDPLNLETVFFIGSDLKTGLDVNGRFDFFVRTGVVRNAIDSYVS